MAAEQHHILANTVRGRSPVARVESEGGEVRRILLLNINGSVLDWQGFPRPAISQLDGLREYVESIGWSLEPIETP